MSSSSTSTGYGGKSIDYDQSVKQFYPPSLIDTWIYSKIKNTNITVLTPINKKTPVVINNDLTVNGDLTVTGTIYNPSDVKLKNNILNIEENKLNELFTINPIHYTFKNDNIQKMHYGVLAQDVEKVFPNLVEEKIQLGYKTVNYIELIPIIIGKMKIMQNQIDKLNEINPNK